MKVSQRAKRGAAIVVLAAAAIVAYPPHIAVAEEVDLVQLVKDADLVIVGQVTGVTEGKLDPDSLKLGLKVRTDIAAVQVTEVLKGDPATQRVEVGCPGFPKPGEVTLQRRQSGIWLLTKRGHPYYEVPSLDCVREEKELGAVRRAVRAAAGLPPDRLDPADRAARLKQLVAALGTPGDVDARRLAAHQLGELGETGAVPALIAALEDEQAAIRTTASTALRKLTGFRLEADLQHAAPDARAAAARTWRDWWETNSNRPRKDILLAALEASSKLQPDAHYALAGLSECDDPALVPLFRKTLEEAIRSRDGLLAAASARYLGRARDRASVPVLIRLIDGSEKWQPDETVRAAAVAAVGTIAGKNFGAGRAAEAACLEWWRTSADGFK